MASENPLFLVWETYLKKKAFLPKWGGKKKSTKAVF